MLGDQYSTRVNFAKHCEEVTHTAADEGILVVIIKLKTKHNCKFTGWQMLMRLINTKLFLL